MRVAIKKFIKKMNLKYGLETYYLPADDVYCMTKKGRAVHNFDTQRFFTIPKRERENMFRPLIKVGLNHNLGEKHRDQIYHLRKIGQKIA